MLAFGETGGIFKKSMEIVFGLGIALNIAAWVGFLIGNTTISSDATVPVVVSMTDAIYEFFYD